MNDYDKPVYAKATRRTTTATTTIGSLSSTSDTNTDIPITSHAHALCFRSVLEVATTVRAILVVVGIERQSYIDPVFYSFFR